MQRFGALFCMGGGGVMNVKTVKDYIDKLSMMGYDFLELFIDDLIKIDGEPYFSYQTGAYTVEELKEIDAYGREKGVEIIPGVQIMAHLGRLLSHPHFFDIKDIDDVILVDEPKTYELIDKIIKTLSEAFTSRNLNIGFDEAEKLGRGKYLDLHGYVNRLDLLLKHLNKVIEITDKYGFKCHMWADMFIKLLKEDGNFDSTGICDEFAPLVCPQEVKDKIPNGVGLCDWIYGCNDEKIMDQRFRTLKTFDHETWYAGAAWTFSGYAPLNNFSIKGMRIPLQQAKKHEIENIVITLWDNGGSMCSYYSVLPSLYAMRQMFLGNDNMESIKEGFEKLFGYPFDNFMLLDIPNKNDSNPDLDKATAICVDLFFCDCFLCKTEWGTTGEYYNFQKAPVVPFGEYVKLLLETGKTMGEYAYLFEQMAALCSALELKADLPIKTRKAYQDNNIENIKSLLPIYDEVIARMKIFRDKFRARWMIENKPYFWSSHQGRLGSAIAQIAENRERLQEYVDGKIDLIPELEEKILE